MKVLKYQQKAVQELVDKSIDLLSLAGQRHTLVFEAPTGAGKTIMASEMLMRLCTELTERADAPCSEVAFMWIAPNKLHEQSYFKMKTFFTETRELHPVVSTRNTCLADDRLRSRKRCCRTSCRNLRYAYLPHLSRLIQRRR